MTIHINARRGFDKSAGNTYHTVTLWVDGEVVGQSDKAYGYGEHFLVTAGHLAAKLGFLPDLLKKPENEATYADLDEVGYEFARWQYRKKNGVTYDVVDVEREMAL